MAYLKIIITSNFLHAQLQPGGPTPDFQIICFEVKTNGPFLYLFGSAGRVPGRDCLPGDRGKTSMINFILFNK